MNVYLELIAQYIIELSNPSLKNVIYREIDINCAHLRIMNEKQNAIELKNNRLLKLS
jgi:hypothetical protein